MVIWHSSSHHVPSSYEHGPLGHSGLAVPAAPSSSHMGRLIPSSGVPSLWHSRFYEIDGLGFSTSALNLVSLLSQSSPVGFPSSAGSLHSCPEPHISPHTHVLALRFFLPIHLERGAENWVSFLIRSGATTEHLWESLLPNMGFE